MSTELRMISARVNPENWTQFKEINKQLGVSNNSMLNLLIAKYNKKSKLKK